MEEVGATAKGKYERWIQPEGLALLRGWARDGLTDEQMAKNMNISAGTLYAWKKDHPEIDEALKSGKEVADYEVENALYCAALSGNVTAMIFWLKNRRPGKWRERAGTEPPEQERCGVVLLPAVMAKAKPPEPREAETDG